ncbi:MAG: hypothetical protein ACE5LU_03170 [Anaerolineae bacterium]
MKITRVMGTDGQAQHEEAIPPLLGRVLHLHMQPAARLTWVGAGWAAICGMVAAGSLHLSASTAVRALLTLVLADSVLGAAWTALFRIRDPFRGELSDPSYRPVTPATAGRVSPEPRVIRTLRPANRQGSDDKVAVVNELGLERAPTSFWASIGGGLDWRPSFRPFDKPFDKLRTPLDSVQVWWSVMTATLRRHGLEVGLPFGLALLLGLVLGQAVAVVVALGLLFPLVVWFALGGHPLRDGWTRAFLEIGLPWTVGLAAFTTLPAMDLGGLSGLALAAVFWARGHMTVLALGFLFIVVYYAKLTLDQPPRVIERRVLLNLPQAAAVVLLAAWQQPILAGAAAILVLAQMLFQPYLDQGQIRWYLRTTQWMFMGVMLIAAIGVAGFGI